MTHQEYADAQQRYRELLRPLQEQLAQDLAATDAADHLAWHWITQGLVTVNNVRAWLVLWPENSGGWLDGDPTRPDDPDTTDTP